MRNTKPASSALIDLPTVAERLDVNQRHIRRLVAERRIPFLKCGHLLRFDPTEAPHEDHRPTKRGFYW